MEAVNLVQEITSSLRVLGLEPGASASDVRQAFRQLARTCHPDVAGRGGTLRFQQIAGAYTLLKGLAPEELKNLPRPGGSGVPGGARAHGRGGLFRKVRHNSSSSSRKSEDEAAKARKAQEQARREAQERETQATREAELKRQERLDRVLDRYDESISRRLERLEREADESLVTEIIMRLRSGIPEVRRLALGRIGSLVNRDDVRQAVTDMLLGRYCTGDDAGAFKVAVTSSEIDEGTARLILALPMTPDTRRHIASDVAENAVNFPDFFISGLLNLRAPLETPDPSLLERYLESAGPSGIALVLYRWPNGRAPAPAVLERLLESSDARILVPLFAAVKQKFPQVIPELRVSLKKLLEHPDPSVRVWCQAFLKS